MNESTSIKNLVDRINAEIALSHKLPVNFLFTEKNKDDSESVWLREPVSNKNSKMALKFSVKGRKNAKYFSLTVKNTVIPFIKIPDDFEVKTINSDQINSFINFTLWNDEAIALVKSIIVYYVETFEPSDKFGCCSKYKEYSNAKKCLHANLFYSKACWYRKNLESGKIFF